MSFGHALKRVYVPIMRQMAVDEAKLRDLFAEAADALPESKRWTGRTFYLTFAT